MLLAGRTTFGTLAAVRIFTELLVEQYAKRMKSGNDFACLIETDIRKADDTISGVGIVDFQTLHDDK